LGRLVSKITFGVDATSENGLLAIGQESMEVIENQFKKG